MLFLNITINFLDRQVLSIVAPLLRDLYHFSDTAYGMVVACFLFGMMAGQIPVGLMLDRLGPKKGFTLMIAGWSVVGMAHSLCRSIVQFAPLRFLLGLNECGTFSGGVKVIGEWFPPAERALASGLFNSGSLAGAVIAPPLIVLIVRTLGWRAAFILPGLVGMLWIVPWLRIYRSAPGPRRPEACAGDADPGEGSAPCPRLRLLASSAVWGVVLMRAFTGPVSHFYWYWLPEYLKHARGLSLVTIGLVAWIPSVASGLGEIVGGGSSSLLVRRGWEPIRARKAVSVAFAAVCLLAVLVPAAHSPAAAIALICCSTFGNDALSATHMAVLTDLFPSEILARVTGLTGVGDNVISIAVMLGTGIVVDHFSYLPVFVAVGVMPVLAVAALLLLVPRPPGAAAP
jgi:ACS family hexuronate transporter-like MFS transporter